ncbi:uncharacterized protein METZ01_LOCUS481502 [marine metagenome]|uniref:Uncharacterized protein n=1 Tax=marine metagenome TaxID=408172 RepID=A0A383CAL3_9ZZZZ
MLVLKILEQEDFILLLKKYLMKLVSPQPTEVVKKL